MSRSHSSQGRRTRIPIAPLMLISMYLALASCSDSVDDVVLGPQAESTSSDNSDFGPQGDAPGPTEAVALSLLDPIDIDPMAEDAYRSFTDSWLRYVVNEAEDGALERLVTDEVLSFFVEWRTANDLLLEETNLRGSVAKSGTIGLRTVEGSDDRVVIEDCMRMTDVNILGTESVRFFWHKTSLENRDETWTVVDFEVLNDGQPSIDPTCVSAEEEGLLADLVSRYAATATEARRDPVSGVDGSGISSLVGEELKQEWRLELHTAAARGERWDQPEQYNIKVLGVDAALASPVALVELCTVFPDGLKRWTSEDTELPVASELAGPTRSRHVLEVPLTGPEAYLVNDVREYRLGGFCGG